MPNDSQRWLRVRDLFDHVIELEEADRAAYLQTACAGDSVLHREVLEMVAADESIGDVFQRVIADANETMTPAAEGPCLERIGPYRVIGELGQGGMGVVLLAERDDGAYQQTVAIKILPAHRTGAEARRRFLAERQILAGLEHSAIARLLDGGTTDGGHPYLVMEHVEGEPLDAYSHRADLDLETRLQLLVAICDAVAHAHGRLVVHRDLKPSNILITADGKPKLLDFGIAKLLDEGDAESTTRTGLLPMTPEYASPEQIAGGAITVATDVYSLGVLLYELLVGVSPYGNTNGSTPALLARAISEDAPERPSSAARRAQANATDRQPVTPGRLEGDLDAIVLTALRKEPDRRYSSVEHLAADLRHFLAGRPVSAMPDAWRYRTGKWLRRNAAAAAMALAVLLALSAGFVARTLEARRAEREATRANVEAARAGRQVEVVNQVSAFLEELFAVSDDSAARGHEVTARELLDRGAERIEHELAGQPLVQARLLHSIGNAYRGLGLFEPAEQLLRHSLDQRSQRLDPLDLDIATTHEALGSLLQETQRSKEAEPHLRAALDIYEQTLRPEDPRFTRALQELALNLVYQMRLDEGEALLLRAAALVEGRVKPDVDLAFNLAVKLTSLYSDMSRPIEALAAARRALALVRNHADVHPTELLLALNNLGQALIENGHLWEAEQILVEAQSLARSHLESGHPLLGTVLRNLGTAFVRLDRIDEAETLLTEALTIHEHTYGKEQFLTQMVHASLALVRLRQGRLVDADALLSSAAPAIEAVFGPDHHVVAEIVNDLATLRQAQGRGEEAEELFLRALEIRGSAFGPNAQRTKETRASLDRMRSLNLGDYGR